MKFLKYLFVAWLGVSSAFAQNIGLHYRSHNNLTSANVVDGNFQLRGASLQAFVLVIQNDAGTLKHAVFAEDTTSALGNYSSKILNASATYTATPTATDASTAMANGGKISAASTHFFVFDTADQVSQSDFVGVAVVALNDTTTPITVGAKFTSRDVNGVTRTRLELAFRKQSDGTAFALTTANIGSGKFIYIQFFGFLK
jgi:hypothetical protein